MVYKYMINILSIDGNYESDFEVSFYFQKLSKFYEGLGFTVHKKTINSSLNDSEILEKLKEINNLSKKPKNKVFISGGVAEPILSYLKGSGMKCTFDKFNDISRVYTELNDKNKLINILLINKKEDEYLMKGFEKIDSMNISLGFKFKIIDCTDCKLMTVYGEILDNLKKEGWETPPLD